MDLTALSAERRPLPNNDPTRRRPYTTRATERLGWQPTVPIEEGLKKTVDDFGRRGVGA